MVNKSYVPRTTKSIKRKKVRPTSVDDLEKKGIKNDVLMYNVRQSIKTENGKIEEFCKDFGDYTIVLNNENTNINAIRARIEFFETHGSFNFTSVSNKYIAVYTTDIELYILKAGTLIRPFIGASSVVYMVICKDNVLFLEEDGTVSIFLK